MMYSYLFLTYKSTIVSLTAIDNLCLYASNYLSSIYNYYNSIDSNVKEFDSRLFKLEMDSILISIPNASRRVIEEILIDTAHSYINNQNTRLMKSLNKNLINITIDKKHLLLSNSKEKGLDSIILVPDLSIVLSINLELLFNVSKIFINNSNNIILGVDQNDC